MIAPSVSPSILPSVAAAPAPDPYWAGFTAGCWVMVGILAVVIAAFLLGRYLELPTRKKK